MNEMGLPQLEGVDAVNIFREIRMIKSEEEIALLRQAARINEEATEVAITHLREGGPWSDIERTFMVEIAKRDGQGVYLSGGSLEGLTEGPLVTMDALCQYKHYHGDLGRTTVLGEPTAEMLRRNKAILAGLETTYELVKPGLPFRELSAKVVEAIHKAGFANYVFVTPHSIGLEHTDHPLPLGAELPGSKAGLGFEENMVFNLDLPFHEWGWGGMHTEETIRVTATGCELLTSGNAQLRRPTGERIAA
jgi:Xaa-Pro aminopeptidase